MTDTLNLKGKKITADSAMEKVIAARARAAETDRYVRALEADRQQLLDEYSDMKNARPVPKSRPAPEKQSKSESVRVTAGDVHGMMMDRAAVDAFLRDVKTLNPDEVVLTGDIVECGGWLAKHLPIGFVATSDYSYQEDILAAFAELGPAAENGGADAIVLETFNELDEMVLALRALKQSCDLPIICSMTCGLLCANVPTAARK